MDKKTDDIIKQYVAQVAKKYPGLVASYLFGSYAKNTETPDSDIDVAFILENLADSAQFDLEIQLMTLRRKFDLRIEPHALSKEEFMSWSPFAHEIRKYGIEIPIGG